MTVRARSVRCLAAAGLFMALTARAGHADEWRIPMQGVKALGTS
jgi:hypothetical protein